MTEKTPPGYAEGWQDSARFSARDDLDQPLQDSLARALALRVGRGREVASSLQLETLVGIPARTIRSYLDREHGCSAANLIKLCLFFGPGFASEVVGPFGLAALWADDARVGSVRAVAKLRKHWPAIVEAMEALGEAAE